MSDPILGIFSHWGEVMMTGLLGVIGWFIKLASGRHFESMDRISMKLSDFGNNLNDTKIEISVIKTKIHEFDERLTKIEDKLG